MPTLRTHGNGRVSPGGSWSGRGNAIWRAVRRSAILDMASFQNGGRSTQEPHQFPDAHRDQQHPAAPQGPPQLALPAAPGQGDAELPGQPGLGLGHAQRPPPGEGQTWDAPAAGHATGRVRLAIPRLREGVAPVPERVTPARSAPMERPPRRSKADASAGQSRCSQVVFIWLFYSHFDTAPWEPPGRFSFAAQSIQSPSGVRPSVSDPSRFVPAQAQAMGCRWPFTTTSALRVSPSQAVPRGSRRDAWRTPRVMG